MTDQQPSFGVRFIDQVERYVLIGWAGRQFDSIEELGMHLGIWLAFFGLGSIQTQPHADWLAVGVAMAFLGQLAVRVNND